MGSRALILYHPRGRFGRGLLNSSCLGDEDGFSIASLGRFPALCKSDGKFNAELSAFEVDGLDSASSEISALSTDLAVPTPGKLFMTFLTALANTDRIPLELLLSLLAVEEFESPLEVFDSVGDER